jgi:glucose-1-phosphate thymidylyltransferase
MKGIILAGGKGTRLYPATIPINKQLLPVYDKPMIYYPISILMQMGIDDILIICRAEDKDNYHTLFRDGEHLGIKVSYTIQDEPNGIAEAFILAEDFIEGKDVALILGDNIFHGANLIDNIVDHMYNGSKATIFSYEVKDPKRYGVVEVDEFGQAISIEEKPKKPKSNRAVTGLYVYDNRVVDIAKGLKPSARGELEITDVNLEYMKLEDLNVCSLDVGNVWLDTGTFDSLASASEYVKAIENRTGKKIACIEEIALDEGFIEEEQFKKLANEFCDNSEYGQYLRMVAERLG